MVAQELDSTNSEIVWDKFQVFQSRKGHRPVLAMRAKEGKTQLVVVELLALAALATLARSSSQSVSWSSG